MGKYVIEFYSSENGVKPAQDFLDILDSKMLAKIFKITDLLEKFGSNVRMPYSEYLEDGIYEIRTKQGNNITRVLYFFVNGRKIILTNGFVKKTQKTPRKEIDRAKKYRDDYMRRCVK